MGSIFLLWDLSGVRLKIFSRKLLLLTCLILALHICRAGTCDGTIKNERIIGTQSKFIHFTAGHQAIINWTWCVAVNSSATGIIVYRVTRVNSQITNHVILSMNRSKNVFYVKDNSRHELSSEVNKTGFKEKAVFVINNISKVDSGGYSFYVRREGYRDLHNEVTIRVNSGESLCESPGTTTRKQENKLLSTKKKGTSYSSERISESKQKVTIIAVSVPICVVTSMAFFGLLKWKIGKKSTSDSLRANLIV